jgi:carbamoylphosphate synthase large subunit
MLRNKKIFLFDLSDSTFINRVIFSLKSIGIKDIYILGIEKNAARYSLQLKKKYLLRNLPSDPAYLLHLLAHHQIDVLLPIDERATKFIIAHPELHQFTRNLHFPSEQTYSTLEDKFLLDKCISSKGFNSVHSRILDLENIPSDLRYPAFVKPRNFSGGIHTQIIHDQTELELLTDQLKSTGLEFIVQDFIEGEDVDASFLCRHGKIHAITIQRSLLGKFHNSSGVDKGVEICMDEDVYTEIKSMVVKLQLSGLFHVGVRREKHTGKLYIIDVNMRFWNSVLASHAANVNFAEMACRLALNETVIPKNYIPVRYISDLYIHRFMVNKFLLRHRDIPLQVAMPTLKFVWNEFPAIFMDRSIRKWKRTFKRRSKIYSE